MNVLDQEMRVKKALEHRPPPPRAMQEGGLIWPSLLPAGQGGKEVTCLGAVQWVPQAVPQAAPKL